MERQKCLPPLAINKTIIRPVPTGGVEGCHTPPGTIPVGKGPNLSFLSANKQLVIYVGKMQKFSYLPAKRYAPV